MEQNKKDQNVWVLGGGAGQFAGWQDLVLDGYKGQIRLKGHSLVEQIFIEYMLQALYRHKGNGSEWYSLGIQN